MSSNLGITDATGVPGAARATPAGWRDPRLWVGVALVAASVLVGARVMGGADRTVEVWAASADLVQGRPVQEGDLTPRSVHFDDEADLGRYLRVADGLPDERTLVRAVGSGELVPVAALGEAAGGLAEVPVWAPAEAVAGSVEPGAVVDVWVTGPGSGGTGPAGDPAAYLVLDDVVVLAAPRPEDSFGPGGSRQVLVGVADADDAAIGEALAAARDDRIAITRQG